MLRTLTCRIAHFDVLRWHLAVPRCPCLQPKGRLSNPLQRYGVFPALPNFSTPIDAIFSTNSMNAHNGCWEVRKCTSLKTRCGICEICGICELCGNVGNDFSCLKKLSVLIQKPESPKNPSNLPQNRLKYRQHNDTPRRKLALYDALKRAFKIQILPPQKQP